MSVTAGESDEVDSGLGFRVFAFLGLLRDSGLPVGPRDYVAVSALLAQLIATRGGACTLRDFRADLAPLLARSPAQRLEFFRLFDAFAPAPADEADVQDGAKQAEAAGTTRHRISRPVWAVAAALICLVIAAGGAGYWYLSRTPQTVKPIAVAVSKAAAHTPSPSLKLPVKPQQTLPAGSATPFVERVFKAAAQHYGAPTLDELARSFATDSPIHWSQEAYAQRLQELTGLPRHQPLLLVEMKTALMKNAGTALPAAGISRALAEIETPGRVRPLSEFASAMDGLLLPGSAAGRFPAMAFAVALYPTNADQPTLLTSVKTELIKLADERDAAARGEAVSAAGTKAKLDPKLAPDFPQRVRMLAKGEAVERSLAIFPDKDLAKRFPGRPWLKRDAPSGAQFASAWMAWAAGAAPLLIALYWLLNSVVLRKAYLRRRPPEFPPLHMDLLAEASAHKRSAAALFHRIGQRLQRRTPRPSDQIDIDATVRASVKAGGMFVVPQFASTRGAPEYLVLIDKAGANDQNSEYLRSLILKLRDLVALELFFYQSEPSMLEPDGGGHPVPIERLQASYPFHRLLILGSGAEFLDPVSRELLPGAEKLAFWERRALLTPLPVAEWAQEEYLLARSLAMPIGRATPEGLMALAQMFRLDGADYDELFDRSGDGMAQPLPDLLRLHTQQYLYSAPPGDHPLEQIVQDLRNYLDAPGFDWLCALAVYPAIQWDLTLYLGLTLAEKAGGDVARQPLYREDRVAALTQLPWLRSGRMPNWLRRALIEALDARRAQDVRAALEKLIDVARSTGDAARDGNIHIRIGREPRKERFEPKELFDDEVLLDFMAKGQIEDFKLPNAQFLSRFLPEAWMHRFGWPELVAAGLAGLYAAVAWLLAPKPGAALVTGAWMPLAALAAGALVVVMIAASAKLYVALRAFVIWLAPFALAAALAFLASLILSNLNVMRWLPNGQPDIAGIADFAPWALVFLLSFALGEAGADFFGLRGGDTAARRLSAPLHSIARGAGFTLVSLLALILSVDTNPGPSGWRWSWIVSIGLLMFFAGVFARRHAPERLTLPGARRFLRFGSVTILALALLALVPLGPAFLLRSALGAAHADLPGPEDKTASMEAQLLAVSPDGRFFATGSVGGEVKVFSASDPGKPLSTIRLQGGRVTALAVRKPDLMPLRVAAATLEQRRLLLFDGATGRKIGESAPPPKPSENPGPVTAAAIGPDGGYAFVREDKDGVPQILTDLGAIAVAGHGAVTALASAGAGRFIYGALDGSFGSVARKGSALVLHGAPAIRSPANAPALAFAKDLGVASSAAYSPVGDQIAVGYAGGWVRVRNGVTGEVVFDLAPPITNRMENVSYSPDGSLLLAVSVEGRVQIWDTRTGKVQSDWTTVTWEKSLSAALSADHRRIGVLSGGRLLFFGKDGSLAGGIVTAETRGFSFAPKGSTVLLVDENGKLRLWDSATKDFVAGWNSPASGIRKAVFSADGSKILAWSDDGAIDLWDARTGKLSLALQRVSGEIVDASISADGTRVAAGLRRPNSPPTVMIWDAGREAMSFAPYQKGNLGAVRLSPDGTKLLTTVDAGSDAVLVWDLSKIKGDYEGGVAIRSIQIDDGLDGILAYAGAGADLSISAKRTSGPDTLTDVEIRDNRNPAHPIVYRAKSAALTPSRFGRLALYDGDITQTNRSDLQKSVLRFSSYIFDLSQFPIRFTATATDGAMLRGTVSNGAVMRVDFAGLDPHLAMGPAVGWQATDAQPQQPRQPQAGR